LGWKGWSGNHHGREYRGMLVVGDRREERMFWMEGGREDIAARRTWVKLWW
jgi:hypothetical protein